MMFTPENKFTFLEWLQKFKSKFLEILEVIYAH